MMNRLFISVCGLLLLFSCRESGNVPSRHSANERPAIQYEARRDTILLEKPYGSVYITNDTTVKYYDWLVPGEDEDYLAFCRSEMQAVLDSNHIRAKHVALGDLPRNYAPLHVYNGNFYVFSPSDWMVHYNDVLTDSAVILVETDPWNVVNVIRGIRHDSPNTVHFQLASLEGTQGLVIRVVDKKHGIVIWEYQDDEGNVTSRSLRVDARKVKQFPMIICDCGENRCVFNWDGFTAPDYEKLIRESH